MEQIALGGEQLRHVVTRAEVVVRVAGEVIAKRVAGPLEKFAGSFERRQFFGHHGESFPGFVIR